MNESRQAHGMSRIKDYIYCCGGLNEFKDLDSCERFCLNTLKWKQDVPNLNSTRLSMTMLVVDHSWLYLFGGCNRVHEI